MQLVSLQPDPIWSHLLLSWLNGILFWWQSFYNYDLTATPSLLKNSELLNILETRDKGVHGCWGCFPSRGLMGWFKSISQAAHLKASTPSVISLLLLHPWTNKYCYKREHEAEALVSVHRTARAREQNFAHHIWCFENSLGKHIIISCYIFYFHVKLNTSLWSKRENHKWCQYFKHKKS